MANLSNLGQNFPVADYYKGRILDAETISRSGGWWTAVLLIEDPKTDQPFVAIYRWENKNGTWKMRKSFLWKKGKDLSSFIEIATRFGEKLKADVAKSPRPK